MTTPSQNQQMVNPPNQPPAHKAEKVFRNYETHIFNLVNNWPKPTTFDPRPVAVTTFTAWMRNAIASVLDFNWTTPVDVERLRQLRPELEIVSSEDGRYVIARRRGPKQSSKVGKIIADLTNAELTCEVANPERHILHALAVLLAAKVLTKPVKLTNVNPDFLNEITENYDVGVSQEGDATILI